MRLMDRVTEFLRGSREDAADAEGDPAELELQAATAVLLLEAAYGDSTYEWSEHRVILRGLEREFGLGRKQTLEVLGKAQEIRPPAVRLTDVTDVIRDRYDAAQKRRLLDLVWKVIEADGRVEPWEEAFAEHVARVLEVSPEEARRPDVPR